MMTIGISADDAHSVPGLQEGRLSRWYDGCQLNNHSGLPPLSIALWITMAPVFLYVLRYPIYPRKFYSTSTLFHLFNRERRILYPRFARLDSSESALEKIDEHVAKMWMVCRRHYSYAAQHQNVTLQPGNYRQVYNVTKSEDMTSLR